MTRLRIVFLSIIVFLTTLMACNDPSELGTDILSGDFSDVKFTDAIGVRTVTVRQDSIFTYTSVSSNQPKSYMVGSIDDPIFGKSKADLYLDFELNTTSNIAGGLHLENATFDSLVLSLAYDSIRVYGDTMNTQSLEVYRVQEEMDRDAKFLYSDQSYMTDGSPIGMKENFKPTPRTPTRLASGDTTKASSPHIRIHLDQSVGVELMSYDSVLYSNTDTFRTAFKGIKIASSVPNSNILGFNVNSTLSYMRLYYTQDTTQYYISYIVGKSSIKLNEFKHDYAGSQVEPFINNVELGDSLIFTQGMSGTHVKLDFPNLEDYKDIVVNKAELEFTVAHIPGDDTLAYSLPTRLALTYLNSEGNYVYISDVVTAVTAQNFNVFGGGSAIVDENGTYVRKYKMSISDYLQDIIDGGGSSMYLQVYLKNQLPRRTILYGGGHKEHPVKLLLTYTKEQ